MTALSWPGIALLQIRERRLLICPSFASGHWSRKTTAQAPIVQRRHVYLLACEILAE